MNSMDWNKVFGAVLVAGIACSAFGVIADNLSHPKKLAKPAIEIEGVPAAATTEAPAAPKAAPPIDKLIATADASAGGADAKKLCSACHNFAEGAGNKVGPDLYGVLGRDRASVAGFDYSSALKGKPGKWTYAELNNWLYSPKNYAPGTKMGFAGIDDDKTRAEVIAYLRSLSASPEPLPVTK